MHASVHFTCKKSSSEYMLLRGCVPIPRYILYNMIHVSPSISAYEMRRYNQN